MAPQPAAWLQSGLTAERDRKIVQIELYGVLKEAAGTDTLEIPAPEGGTVAAALDQLAASHPALAKHLERAAAAVGDQLVNRNAPVDDATRLVLLPPVSGG